MRIGQKPASTPGLDVVEQEPLVSSGVAIDGAASPLPDAPRTWRPSEPPAGGSGGRPFAFGAQDVLRLGPAVGGVLAGAALLSTAGCASLGALGSDALTLRTANALLFQGDRSPVIDEAAESAAIGSKNGPGKLLPVRLLDGGGPTTITIHGINASPESTRPLTDRALTSSDGQVLTFAYDDRFRTLFDSSRDLANELAPLLEGKAPLAIHTHSMGGRIALGALKELDARGLLEGSGPIDLVMIAPPLAGYRSADGARLAPDFLAGMIGGVRPGRDMGTGSRFQKMIEDLELPSHVRVRIFIGTNDEIVDGGSASFRRIAKSLGATITELDGADHDSAVPQTAPLLDH